MSFQPTTYTFSYQHL